MHSCMHAYIHSYIHAFLNSCIHACIHACTHAVDTCYSHTHRTRWYTKLSWQSCDCTALYLRQAFFAGHHITPGVASSRWRWIWHQSLVRWTDGFVPWALASRHRNSCGDTINNPIATILGGIHIHQQASLGYLGFCTTIWGYHQRSCLCSLE